MYSALNLIYIKALQKADIFVFRSFAKYKTQPVLKFLNVSKISCHNRLQVLKTFSKEFFYSAHSLNLISIRLSFDIEEQEEHLLIKSVKQKHL